MQKERIISADGHIDLNWLPADIFEKYGDRAMRDRMPKVVDTKEGRRWMIGETVLSAVGGMGTGQVRTIGLSEREKKMRDMGLYDDAARGVFRPTQMAERLKDLEHDGIDAEVVYGILGAGERIADVDVRSAVFQAYNRWLAEWCKQAPERIIGLAEIPNHDPEIAAATLKEGAKMGLRGADFPADRLDLPLWHPSWDPVWATAQDCNIPISFHTTGSKPPEVKPEYVKAYPLLAHTTRSVSFQLVAAEVLSNVLFSGIFHRFPKLQFVMGESGVGWIPYVLERLDESWEDRYAALIPELPSFYWHRQGHTTFQHEGVVFRLMDYIGEDKVMWGADYPHQDGAWPESQATIQRYLGNLEPRIRRKLIHDTAQRLYNVKS